MARFATIVLAAASLGMAGAAQAKVEARQPASVVKAMKKAGFPAELSKDDAGDPIISSRSEGTDFFVHFYGCEGGRACTRVQFMRSVAAPKSAAPEALNAWNAENYFGRAYRNEEGAARLEMDLDLDDGGMSDALFADNLQWWATIIDDFQKHVDGDAAAGE